MKRHSYKLMIVVGEASGDSHAAQLVNSLRAISQESEIEIFGATAEKLRKIGAETIINADELAIMGLLEVGNALPMFLRVFRKLKQTAIARKPDAILLVDFPEFNLKLARALKREGFRVIYYVSPQLWAWRSYRVELIRKYVDLLLTILPFEKDWYAQHGVKHVEYVGHPLVGEVKAALTRDEFCAKHNLDPQRKIVALLPGSRRKELTKILPPMLDAVSILNSRGEEIQFVVTIAPTRTRGEITELISSHKNSSQVVLVESETRDAVAAADAAIVASGTATLETALLNTPLAVVYKVSWHSWHTLRHLVHVPHYGLINLITGDRIASELIQSDCTGERIAAEILRLLETKTNTEFRARLKEVTKKLGDGGASEKAARAVLKFLMEDQKP